MPYLTDVKGFTNQSVANDIFPVSIYASLVFYLVAGPVSRRIGLKTFVLLGATCKLWTRILLVWGTSLGAMQSTQVLFAAGSSADAILLAYAYAVARKDDGDAHPTPTSMPKSNRPRRRGPADGTELSPPRSARRTSGRTPSPRSSARSRTSPGRRTRPCSGSHSAPSRLGARPRVLPPERAIRPRPGPASGYTARPTRTTYAPRPTRTLREELHALAKATRDAFDATTSACYGSGVMIVLSAWWVLSAAPASFLEWYGTNLFDVIDGDADVNGYVVFFARLAMTAAAWAGGSEWVGGRGRAHGWPV